MNRLNIYLTDEEKDRLKQYAKNQNVPMSVLVKQELHHILSPSTLSCLGVTMENLEEDHPVSETRNRMVKVYLSEEEYRMLEKAKGSLSMSAFVRKQVFSHGLNQFHFEIHTQDLEELIDFMAEINLHVTGFIGGMRFRKDVYDSDLTYLQGLLSKLNLEVEKLYKIILGNRKAIRKQGRKILKQQLVARLSIQQKGKESL